MLASTTPSRLNSNVPSTLETDEQTLERTSKLLYADKVWRKTIIYLISRGVPEYKYAKHYLMQPTLIMLERTMYVAIVLLLIKHRFQNH